MLFFLWKWPSRRPHTAPHTQECSMGSSRSTVARAGGRIYPQGDFCGRWLSQGWNYATWNTCDLIWCSLLNWMTLGNCLIDDLWAFPSTHEVLSHSLCHRTVSRSSLGALFLCFNLLWNIDPVIDIMIWMERRKRTFNHEMNNDFDQVCSNNCRKKGLSWKERILIEIDNKNNPRSRIVS